MTRSPRAALLSLFLTGCFGPLKPPSDAAADATRDVSNDAPLAEAGDVEAVDAAPDVTAQIDVPPDVLQGDVAPDGEAFDASPDIADDTALDAADHDVAPDLSPDAALDAPVDRGVAVLDAPTDRGDAALDAPTDRGDAALDAPTDRGSVALDAPPDPTVSPPRLLAPLSSSRTSARPRFAWRLAADTDGAVIDICRDRACTAIERSFTVTGEQFAATTNLARGYRWWRARGRRGATPGVSTSPVWEFYVAPRTAGLDTTLSTAWASMPDLNGDGRTDLIVGAPNASVGLGSRAGLGYFFAGAVGGFASTPTLTYNSSGDRTAYGSHAKPLGDLNGDGFPEFGFAGANYAQVFRGAATPSTVVYREYSGFTAPSSAGDVNGDGFGDLLCSDGVRIGVFFGSTSGPAATPARMITASSAVALGDLNGDGFGEIAVLSSADRISVHDGSSTGTQLAATYTLDGPRGWALSNLSLAGDVNADGVVDLIATATVAGGAAPSRAAVITLVRSASDPASPPALLSVPLAVRVASFGAACAGIGDVNGDGIDDVAAGTGTNDTLLVNQVCVYAGATRGVASTPLQCLTAASLGRFGASLGGVGDVDGDGFEDLIVGARGTDTTRGTARLFRGRAAGVLDTAVATITAGDVNAQFSAALSAWR